jgi:hypothetical protein
VYDRFKSHLQKIEGNLIITIGKCLHNETMTLKEYIGYIKEIDPWITIGILGIFIASIIYYILQRRYKDVT